MRIFTIGYENATVPDFVAALTQAGVKRVIDVRAVPNSRRPGFSKTPLRTALAVPRLEPGGTRSWSGSTRDSSSCRKRWHNRRR